MTWVAKFRLTLFGSGLIYGWQGTGDVQGTRIPPGLESDSHILKKWKHMSSLRNHTVLTSRLFHLQSLGDPAFLRFLPEDFLFTHEKTVTCNMCSCFVQLVGFLFIFETLQLATPDHERVTEWRDVTNAETRQRDRCDDLSCRSDRDPRVDSRRRRIVVPGRADVRVDENCTVISVKPAFLFKCTSVCWTRWSFGPCHLSVNLVAFLTSPRLL